MADGDAKELFQKIPRISGKYAVILVVVLVAIVVAVALLSRGGKVSGTVRDGSVAVLTPIQGAVVTVGDEEIITDGEGKFTLTGCRPGESLDVSATGFESKRIPATSLMDVLLVPTPQETVNRWFAAWRTSEYQQMYSRLARDCQQAVSERDFIATFQSGGYLVRKFTTQPAQLSGDTAQVEVEAVITTLLGEQTFQQTINLVRENQIWKVVWYSQEGKQHPALKEKETPPAGEEVPPAEEAPPAGEEASPAAEQAPPAGEEAPPPVPTQ